MGTHNFLSQLQSSNLIDSSVIFTAIVIVEEKIELRPEDDELHVSIHYYYSYFMYTGPDHIVH